jgi:hypothetical protein
MEDHLMPFIKDRHNNLGRHCVVSGDEAAGLQFRRWRVVGCFTPDRDGRFRFLVRHEDTGDYRCVRLGPDASYLY